jgi:hypothetical protein
MAVFDKSNGDPHIGVLPHREILYADNSRHATWRLNEKLRVQGRNVTERVTCMENKMAA